VICHNFEQLCAIGCGSAVQALMKGPRNRCDTVCGTSMALHSSSNVPGWQQQRRNANGCRPLTHRLRAGHPHSIPSTANVAAAAQVLGLDTRTAASVLWDLDNVCPASPRTSLLPAIQEVKILLLSMGLSVKPSVTCYANMATTRALGEHAEACVPFCG
jgi:hypothetical protein